MSYIRKSAWYVLSDSTHNSGLLMNEPKLPIPRFISLLQSQRLQEARKSPFQSPDLPLHRAESST